MLSFLSKVQTRSESRFIAFKTLIQVLPSVGKAIEDPTTDIDVYLMQVSIVCLVSCQFVYLGITLFSCKKGANDARSDDVRRIKEELALWLNIEYTPNPPLNTKCRSDRGLQNNIQVAFFAQLNMIGMMSRKSRCSYYSLCNHINPYRVRDGIRAGTVNISEDYFLRCFYPYGNGDPDNVEKGFLRSGLLVKV